MSPKEPARVMQYFHHAEIACAVWRSVFKRRANKNKIIAAIVWLVFLPLMINHALAGADAPTFDSRSVQIAGEEYLLEIAKTRQQRQYGLMFRRYLGPRQGMLFIYPEPGDHRIWMKNTKISLTVIWLSAAGRVIKIQQLQPCRQNTCESYGADQRTKYIIELNHGPHKIKLGDLIPGLNRF